MVRMATLMPEPYSPRWTVLDDEYFAARDWVPSVTTYNGDIVPSGSVTVTVTPPTPVSVVHEEIGSSPNAFNIGTVPVQILNNNPKRRGLILQNLDTVDTLFYSFNVVADPNSSLQLAPGGAILLDFVTPTGPLWVVGSGALKLLCSEFSAIS